MLQVGVRVLLSRAFYTASGNLTAISPDCVMYLTQGSDGYCSYWVIS